MRRKGHPLLGGELVVRFLNLTEAELMGEVWKMGEGADDGSVRPARR